jgi:hypothetical protein
MTRETVCPSCGRTLRVPEQALGQPVQCPACAAEFTAAPAPAPVSPPVAAGESGGAGERGSGGERTARSPPLSPAAADPPDEDEGDEEDDEAPTRPPPPYVLHPAVHATLATVVSVSPLGGCAVLAVNYLQRRRVLAAVLVLLAGLAGAVGLLWAMRDEQDYGRGLLLGVLCLPLMHLVALALQGRDYHDYLAQGGAPAPLRRAFVLGLLALLLQVGLHAALGTLFPGVFPPVFPAP